MESLNPLISIIVPIYNAEPYLPECIESICKQTYQKLEIILVDDGSTDRSFEICSRYKEQDSRIKLLHQDNGGHTSARKAGLRMASGEYVGFIDADDWIDADYYEKFAEAVTDESIDMVCVQSTFLEHLEITRQMKYGCPVGVYTGKALLRCVAKERLFAPKELSRSLWSKLFKKELLAEIMPLVDDRILVSEDSVAVFGAVSRADKVVLLERGGYHYRQWDASVTHRKREILEKLLDIRLRMESCQRIMDTESWDVYETLFWLDVKRYYWNKDMTFFDDIFTNGGVLAPFSGGAKRSDRIVLYGAGDCGKKLREYLEQQQVEIVAWVDADWQNRRAQGVLVDAIDSFLTKEFDKVVVAVLDERVSKQIASWIKEQGIPDDKILRLSDGFPDDVESIKNACIKAWER
ncbi:MAG: glycosyltransferase [Lachnospiraceae bacterium]|nr:glycosyltransferase [Lachnospiraceae bacterium]